MSLRYIYLERLSPLAYPAQERRLQILAEVSSAGGILQSQKKEEFYKRVLNIVQRI